MNTATKSRSWSPGVLLTGIVAIAAVAAFAVFVMQTRDVQRVAPHVVGSLWPVRVGDATRVCFITREDRAVVRAFDIEGMHTYQHTYSIYLLNAHAARDGARLASVEIARVDTTKPDFNRYVARVTLAEDPEILGTVDESIWLWNSGLEARNAVTFATQHKPADIAAANPLLAPFLPDDRKYTKVSKAFDALVIKSRDARYYKADLATAKLEPLDEATLSALSTEHTKTAESAFTNLIAEGRSLTASTGPGVWCRKALVEDGLWIALLTADERARLSPRLGAIEDWEYHNWAFTFGETARTAFRGRYKVTHEPNFARHAMDLDLTSIEPMCEERLLMAGLLRRPGDNQAWTVEEEKTAAHSSTGGDAPQTKSQLVLHRKSLGEKQPWCLLRLGRDGKIRWDRSTGLNELNELCDADGIIVLTGFSVMDANEPKGTRPERMLFVSEKSGHAAAINIASGELSSIE